MVSVGFVLNQPSHGLGASIRPWQLIQNVAALGVETHVFTDFREDREYWWSKGVAVHTFPSMLARLRIQEPLLRFGYMISRSKTMSRVFFNRLSLDRLSRQLANEVLSFGPLVRNIDLFQGEQEIASIACLYLRVSLRRPVISDMHGLLVEELLHSGRARRGDIAYRSARSVTRRILSESDAVIVVSEEMREYLSSAFTVHRRKLVVIGNAASPMSISRVQSEKPKRVVYAGSLEFWENVDLFIKSIPLVTKRIPYAQFFVIGEGSEKRRLMSMARRIGARVTFLNTIPRKRLFDFLKDCDVGVVPSTTDITRTTASPIKVFDYMSMGLPLVCVRVGAWSRIIEENRSGLVTYADPESFAEAIVWLLEHPDKLSMYGLNGKEAVAKEHNWKEKAKMLVRTYETLSST